MLEEKPKNVCAESGANYFDIFGSGRISTENNYANSGHIPGVKDHNIYF